MTINRVRKNIIKRTALDCLKFTNTSLLPIDVFKIIESYKNCTLVPYSEFMKENNLSLRDVITMFKSEHSCTAYSKSRDKYLIYYNDVDMMIKKSNRYRWNIIHELGHIVLGHFKLANTEFLYRNGFTNNKYKALEDEADQFAAYILVPHAALKMAKIKDNTHLKELCKISKQAASYRYRDYLIWLKRNPILGSYDTAIQNLFFDFINKCYCNVCGFNHLKRTFNYCPICGTKINHFIFLKGLEYMIYKGYNVDEKGKMRVCPKCQNEEVKKGDYCPICGLDLVNRCTGRTNTIGDDGDFIPCGQIQAGNARYCVKCGKETTFFENGLLKSWEKEIENQTGDIVLNDNDLPF